ncbi:MAG: aminofutalosine synthase MqnE [Proteobacteria bacterium]|nr:aminofutalosine synthase MqnE [Pseudomonadota bacterium]MBU1686547.1 aminofutalosine synthase MqnE [Pseudomonadota bacterium]
MENYINKAGLADILVKINQGIRLTVDDGIRLYQSPDLLAVGYMANLVRERLNGNRAYFIYNQHINYSNICTNLCKFCAFGKAKESDQAYEMTVEDVKEKVRERLDEPITEIHLVGGIHPDLPYYYYRQMLMGIKEVRPEVHIQAFTCVELAHLAEISGLGLTETLRDLVVAGLGSIPGGGAEVFSPRIRKLTCEKKLSGEGWLAVAQNAHRLGIRSNATMLYGHIESVEERIEHLDMLRRAQDETGGFLTYIPLAFHPRNTELHDLSRTTGIDDLKNIAVARCFLDNFTHIKAYWIMIGPKLTQIALSFGADDVDGTVKEEIITHMAGADTDQAMSRDQLLRIIREAGRQPVERDTLYNVLREY